MKYELSDEETLVIEEKTLYRIVALRDFLAGETVPVQVGQKGGFVESDENLSQSDDGAWIFDNAACLGNSYVKGSAIVCGKARVRGNTLLTGRTTIGDSVLIDGDSLVKDSVLKDDCVIKDSTLIDARIGGNAHISEDCYITASSLGGDSLAIGSEISRKSLISGEATIKDSSLQQSKADGKAIIASAILVDCGVSADTAVAGATIVHRLNVTTTINQDKT